MWRSPRREKGAGATIRAVTSTLRSAALAALSASERGGFFGLADAERAGFSAHAVSRRVASGELIRVLPGVFTWSGTQLDWPDMATAISMWGGEDSALSFRTAAVLLGLLSDQETPFHISIVGGGRAPTPEIKVHRVDGELLRDIVPLGTARVTSVRRTLMDLAGRKDPRFQFALDRALRLRRTSLRELARLVEEPWARGRRGVAILGVAVQERTPGLGPTDSDMEELFARIVRQHNLPRPQRQYPISVGGRVNVADFAYPEVRLAVECDSKAWHLDGDSFVEDRLDDAALAVQGWQVLRFTWGAA
jgi:very-short-patch-repair endonuclease